jgi:Pentapeptide repeats (9 copies)
MTAGLIVGRTAVQLDRNAIAGGREELYAAQLLDKAHAVGQEFHHCTFANVSFLEATLERCRFLNCSFVDCYFRQTRIENCSFVGAKFVDCQFIKPHFMANIFEFPQFRNCFIPWVSFGSHLPPDAGFRSAIADELAREAGAAGKMADARRYRLVGEEAHEKELWNIAWASGGPYYEKDRPPLERVHSVVRWAGRKFNRHLWGYGERGAVLARSFLLTALVFALAFRWFASSELTQDDQALSFGGYCLYTFDNLLAGTGFSHVETSGSLARWLSGLEIFAGLVFIGLFVSLVFNWIRRR